MMALTGPGFGVLGHQDVSVHAPRLQTHYCFATSVLHLFPMQLRTIATHVYFFFFIVEQWCSHSGAANLTALL